MRAKKHLGQHFLTSKKALRTIIEAAQIQKGELVLEIGPGEGVLTRALLDAGARVMSVETDADMIAVLEERFEDEIAEKQLTLVHGDILKLQIFNNVDAILGRGKGRASRTKAYGERSHEVPDKGVRHISGNYKLVANIPYYVTGEILRRFLSSDTQPVSMTLLVQKEVAERIARSKKETVLSLSVKCYGIPRYVQSVSARYFNPPPKVDSAILHIGNISKHFFDDFIEERFFKVVKAGFSSKRKKLVNNLAVFGSKERLEEALTQSGIPKDARAEDVSLERWKELVNNLS